MSDLRLAECLFPTTMRYAAIAVDPLAELLAA